MVCKTKNTHSIALCRKKKKKWPGLYNDQHFMGTQFAPGTMSSTFTCFHSSKANEHYIIPCFADEMLRHRNSQVASMVWRGGSDVMYTEIHVYWFWAKLHPQSPSSPSEGTQNTEPKLSLFPRMSQVPILLWCVGGDAWPHLLLLSFPHVQAWMKPELWETFSHKNRGLCVVTQLHTAGATRNSRTNYTQEPRYCSAHKKRENEETLLIGQQFSRGCESCCCGHLSFTLTLALTSDSWIILDIFGLLDILDLYVIHSMTSAMNRWLHPQKW